MGLKVIDPVTAQHLDRIALQRLHFRPDFMQTGYAENLVILLRYLCDLVEVVLKIGNSKVLVDLLQRGCWLAGEVFESQEKDFPIPASLMNFHDPV